jgi:hypothetical protein
LTIRQRLNLDEFQIRQSVQRLVSDGLLEIEEAKEELHTENDRPATESSHSEREPVAVGIAAPQTKVGLLPRLFGRRGA